MIKVLEHGNKIGVRNPITGLETVMVNVIFVEFGRSGANQQLSGSSAFLSAQIGKQTGIDQLRTHTQAVLEEQLTEFPVGREFEGHINRVMYSNPQMRQQIGVAPRNVDGRPTYFVTEIGAQAVEDIDRRIDQNVLVQVRPDLIFNSNVGGAQVRIIEARPRPGQLAQANQIAGTGGVNLNAVV